jgi:hypothetical protein
MCKSCGCEELGKPVQYMCDCIDKECSCDSIIEFDEVPKTISYCCGDPTLSDGIFEIFVSKKNPAKFKGIKIPVK